MTESANCVPQDSEFLSVGDWISIHHWEKVVCSQGFKTQEVTLKPSASW